MASTSSSTPSNLVTLSSTLSLPRSCTSHTSNKIENLVEYSYIPDSAQISESSYPLISPYQLYKRPSSFTRSIRTSYQLDGLNLRNISSLLAWTNVLFKQPLLTICHSGNSFRVNFPIGKGKVTLISILRASN